MNFQEDFESSGFPQFDFSRLQLSLDVQPLPESVPKLHPVHSQSRKKQEINTKLEDFSEEMDLSADASNTLSRRDCSTLDKELPQKDAADLKVARSLKRLKPEDDSESPTISLMEKDKLERNRICARECRRRKKIYVKNLEQQIKNLKNELVECRRELSSYKVKEQEEFFSQFNMEEVLGETSGPAIAEKALTNSKRLIKKHLVTFLVLSGIGSVQGE